jgi:hypothetical protein
MAESPDAKKNAGRDSSEEQSSTAPKPAEGQQEANQPTVGVKEDTPPPNGLSTPAETKAHAQRMEVAGADTAQPRLSNAPRNGWTVILVEDNPNTREEIKDFFDGKLFDDRPLVFQEIADWQDAYWLIRERKADLVILDIYRGEARIGGERVGERVLGQIEKTGFTSVILFTNLPEGLDAVTNAFVRLVPKINGLAALERAITAVFATKIPQMHRAIVDQLDKTLCNYMWGFVVKQWEGLKDIADKPEFLRLLIQRLAMSLVREGIDAAVAKVFGKGAETAADKIHPAEVYIKPPIGPDPLLGDIRVRKRKRGTETETEYLVVIWPSCDMVSVSGRTPKTDTILCARASAFVYSAEVVALRGDNSQKNQKRVKMLIANNRDSNLGSPDRFHFLPGICDVPGLVIDFQALEDIPLADARSLECAASLASPFAEHLASRFLRYIGRLGTPDVDSDLIVNQLTSVQQRAVTSNGAVASAGGVDHEKN